MATKYLDNTGLAYFWGKIKSWVTSRGYITSSGSITGNAATATRLAGPKHSYTTAANAAKNWYRIANANTSQTDTTKPIHAQFLLTAYNTSYDANYYEEWYIICTVFGRAVHITLFGNHNAPFSQARVLYENTTADVDSSDRPAIDIYLNNQLANGTTKIEVEEVYNSGWTFIANGQLAVSTIPTGFENAAISPRNVGIYNSTFADYASRATLNRSNITSNITLADNNTYRAMVLNCTNAITVTVPSINSTYSWFIIKNFNAISTNKNVTVHPSTTSVLIDNSNADIVLKPGEWVIIASKAANSYSLIADGRWKSQKADKATTLAGYGITDAKIANGTITLGSSSITPLTSVPSHNQASNTINAMTGYSKPSSTSAIVATDTLNQAVGKLEKEDEYLHDEFLLVKGTADNCYAATTAHQLLVESMQDALESMLQDKIYPVGSTYFSLTDSRNPNTILGFGTWTAIEGRFLLGASSSYAADSTGGEATHTLTESEMPQHYHDSLRYQSPTAAKFGCNSGTLSDTSWTVPYASGQGQDYYVTGNTGGSQAHNNMPPYLAGFLWRRTA